MLVYASLVPLQYRPLSWGETFARWDEVPWLKLGVYRRADWVANALVVIPSGFFATGAVWFVARPMWLRVAAAFLITALLAVLVFGIEFFQLWFPPRTVSQNDIFAGCAGAVAGPALWFVVGPASCWWLHRFLTIPTVVGRLRVLALFGMVGGAIYSVFPMDAMISGEEFRQKWSAGRIILNISPSHMVDREAIKGVILSALRMLPWGLWFGLRRHETGRLPRGGGILPGRVTGLWIVLAALGLEVVQVPIFSKYSSSLEVIAGVLGGSLGWWLGRGPRFVCWFFRSPWFWGLATVAIAGLLPLMMLVRHDSIVDDATLLASRWDGFWTAPLLRYYYTSEYAALSNLAGKLGLFACLGVAVAGWCWAANVRYRWSSVFLGAIFAGGLGLAIEVAQIYLLPLIGDATDVAIYVAGYLGGAGCTLRVLGDRRLESENGNCPDRAR